MSSNKCKTWPMENLENLLKIDTNLVTMKNGSCDHFLTNLKNSDPDKAGDGWIQKKILIDVAETGIPIFRHVVVTIVVAENDTPI